MAKRRHNKAALIREIEAAADGQAMRQPRDADST